MGRASEVTVACSTVWRPGTAGSRVLALRPIRQALICLNPDQPWKIGFDGRLGIYDLRYTLMHEIGHAIGLDHPGASGALMGFRYDEKRDGLAPADIEAAQKLYGTQDLR